MRMFKVLFRNGQGNAVREEDLFEGIQSNQKNEHRLSNFDCFRSKKVHVERYQEGLRQQVPIILFVETSDLALQVPSILKICATIVEGPFDCCYLMHSPAGFPAVVCRLEARRAEHAWTLLSRRTLPETEGTLHTWRLLVAVCHLHLRKLYNPEYF